MTVEEFVERVAPLLIHRRVQLVPEFAPDHIAFMASLPDRFLAGQVVYDGLVAGGFEPVHPLRPYAMAVVAMPDPDGEGRHLS